jgi:hypothetical protein
MTSLDAPRPDRVRQLAVPALLIVVASVQIYLAKTHELTPWKGGGFGMFSTVDDVQARWIRCYAITNGRETPADAPDQFVRPIARLRAMPCQERLQQLANDYGRMRFVNQSFDENTKAELKQSADPSSARDIQPAAAPAPTAADVAASLRVWEPDEREPKPSELAAVQSVRVELWRWRFDLPSRKMLAWKAAEASAPAARESAR